MKLEDEIQQKAFKSPQQKLAINLTYTATWLNNFYSDFFKDHDLSIQQFNVLRILRGQRPNYCSLKTIKERMIDRTSDTSRIVDKLVSKGLVTRCQCPNDRRSVDIIISEKGLDLLTRLDYIDDAMKDIFNNLSTEQVNMLNLLLDNLRG